MFTVYTIKYSKVFQRRRTIVLATVLFLTLQQCRSKTDTVFSAVSSSESGIDFQNDLPQRPGFNILYYIYFYNGGGVAAGDIDNDGLTDLYFAANTRGNNKLYRNRGGFQFEEITATANAAGDADWSSGVTMADVNGDGWLDIYISTISGVMNLQGHNQLLINNRNGTFTDSSEAYGLAFSGFSTQAAFFDYDHDGDLDCYLLNQSHHPNQNIKPIINRTTPSGKEGDILFRQEEKDGHPFFTDVSAAAGIYQSSLGYGLGLSIADLNNDGWDDIYVGNDFHENDYCYINQRDGSFSEEGETRFRHYSRFSMGNDIADVNNDAQPDIITVDMLPDRETVLKTYGSDENPETYNLKIRRNGFQDQYSRNCLQLNLGGGKDFSEIGLQAGLSATDWSWSPLIADFDNDGKKDVFISSGIVKRPSDLDYIKYVSALYEEKMRNPEGDYDAQALQNMPEGSSHPFFFANQGRALFKDVSREWGTAGMKGFYNGAAYADLDNDGDLDLVINAINQKAVLLRNNSDSANGFLRLTLTGIPGNSKGLGAKIWLFQKGQTQYQQLQATHGFQSASDQCIHFGLGNLEADSLLVVWPDDRFKLLVQPKPGNLQLDWSAADSGFRYANYFADPPPAWSNLSAAMKLGWQHKEDPYTDFNVQYLIPHMESTRGPALAVADVNGDGLDDFFVGAARGQLPALFFQQRDGSFLQQQQVDFSIPTAADQNAAVFADLNGDRFPDLVVAVGGNEFDDGNPALSDLVYLNDGKGKFRLQERILGDEFYNSTTVAAADIDADGDTDLFIGCMPGYRSYGTAATGLLLLNDGSGRFTKAGRQIFAGDSLGMLTTAGFQDLNGDDYPELVVAGEWMPITIFNNDRGRFTKSTVANSTGLWQKIYLADADADGDLDILAGNWGENSKLAAGKDSPLKMYVKDFDHNRSLDQLVAYRIGNEEYSFLAKDELERSIPALKKGYLTYNEVAGKSIQYMMADLFVDPVEWKAEILASGIFLNDGKGIFSFKAFPPGFQRAPVFAFSSGTTKQSWLGAGNFYGVTPYEARYDALNLEMLQLSSDSMIANDSWILRGEVRQLAWLKGRDDHKILLVARNNEPLIFLKPATND